MPYLKRKVIELLKIKLKTSPSYAEELLNNYNNYYYTKRVNKLRGLTEFIEMNTNEWNAKWRSYFYMWYIDKLTDIVDRQKKQQLQRLQYQQLQQAA